MRKGPLGQRAGSFSNRAGGPVFEAMEPRVLLAATTAAANVFAQFDGVIASGRSTVTIPINFTSGNFTFSGGKSVLGVSVVSQSGSTLDAGIVQIKNAHNQNVAPIFKSANLPHVKNSLALANFSARKYKLVVGSERNTTGAFTVNVFLAGDVNGDRQVNTNDAKTVKKNLGKRAGQSGYSVSADTNLSGTIDAFDVAQATANNKDKTSINPIPLTLALTPPPSIVLPGGTYLTANTSVTLSGHTLKSLGMLLDPDGPGSYSVGFRADTSGNFVLPVNLVEGLNPLLVRAADSFGQIKSATINVQRDSTAPTFSNVGLASGFEVAGSVGHTTARSVTITGTTEPLSTLSVNGSTATAAADGSFSISDVVLTMGANNLTITATDRVGNSTSTPLTLTRQNPSDDGQIVLDWDSALLSAIAANASTPPEASRAMAIVHAAIYDAVNAIDRSSGFLFVSRPAASGASAAAAVAAAAHRALSHLFPAQTTTFDALLSSSLAGIADGAGKTDGISLGQSVADAMLALRENDGSTDYVSYQPGTDVGDWQQTAPAFAPALLPNWATLTPFAMNADSQFRPDAPPDLSSDTWADDLNEVKSLGKSDSSARTADQTAIARFWADGAGTITPAGHWNQIAAKLADDSNKTLFENARMFAVLDVAMADAAIVSWDAKYAFNFWRPVTAIHDAALDDNSQTSADSTWMPLINTPPFPEYISGHSTFSSAAAVVLGSIFGSNASFTATSPFPNSVPRTFSSFEAAAQEASDSRIYGGIHYRSSTEAGLVAGNALGEFVLDKFSDSADTTPPTILFSTAEGTVKTDLTISGQVVDGLSGIKSLKMTINGGVPGDVTFDEAGNFTLNISGTDGPRTLAFVAADSAGNVSAPINFVFTIDSTAPTITNLQPAAAASIASGSHVSGKASGTGSSLVALTYAFDSGPAIPLSFSANGDFDQALDLSSLGAGPHVLKVSATDAAGNVLVVSRNISLPSAIPLTISDASPQDGAIDVGSTYRPKIAFSRAIDTTTLNSTNFFATSGGQKLAATIVPASDGTFAWLFFTNPMPGGSIVQITLDGSTISAADSTKLDADGDGVAGGTLTFSFTTVSLTNVANTAIHGIVADPGPDLKPNTADDVRAGPDGVLMTSDDIYLHPIAGVTVTVLGQSSLTMTTGADGRFGFAAIPSGNLKLVLDGNTTTPPPTGFYFPEMVMDLNIRPGLDNTIMATMQANPSSAGLTSQGVYLPRIQRSVLKSVGANGTTTIGVDATAAPDLTPQQRSMLSIDIPGGSLVRADGTKMSSGQVGISTVPPELVMDMLPPGVLQHTFDITVQAPGVSTFDTPAAMTFPNVFNAAPGTKLDFLSFDHTTGRLVIEGTATVSADGLSVHTDPGSGITHPGWHGLTPPGTQTRPPCVPGTQDIVVDPVVKSAGLGDQFYVNDDGSFTMFFGNGAHRIDPTSDPCSITNVRATPLIVKLTVDGAPGDFLDGLGSQTFALYPQEDKAIKVDVKDLLTPARINSSLFDQLYGVKVTAEFFKAGGELLSSSQFYVYRFFDISDDKHADGTIDFEKTFTDGAGNAAQRERIIFSLPGSATPTIMPALGGPGATFNFAGDEAIFDPITFLGERNDNLLIRAPDNTQVGQIALRGTAIGKQRVLFPKSVFSDAIKKVVDQNPVNPDYTNFVALFPNDSNANNLRSDEAGFAAKVDSLYAAVVRKLDGDAASAFGQLGDTFRNAIDIVDSTDGSGIFINSTFSGRVRVVSIPFAIYNANQVGSTLDIGTLNKADAQIRTGPIPDGTTVTLSFQDSTDGINWTTFSTKVLTHANENKASIIASFQNLDRYVRVISTHAGGGNATYRVRIAAHDNPCGSPDTGACAYWADFGEAKFGTYNDAKAVTGGYLKEEDQTSLPQERFLFAGITNRSFSDDEGGKTAAVRAQMDLLAADVQNVAGAAALEAAFTTVVANGLAHEIGHDLGAIHYRDVANAYINGDIMGNQGSQTDAVHTFVKLKPVVALALGLPIDLADSSDIWTYYDQYDRLEPYRQNQALQGPGDSDSDLGVDAPLLTVFDGPLVNGQALPNIVNAHVFADTIADGAGGQSSTITLHLFNNGFEPLTISSIGLAQGNTGFSIENINVFPLVIPPIDPENPQPAASARTIVIRFDPSLAGNTGDTLKIVSDSIVDPLWKIALSGLGVSPFGDIAISSANNNLGGLKVSAAPISNASFATITNHGSTPLRITGMNVTGMGENEFSLLGLPANLSVGNPITLAPGATFTFGASFDAAGIGLQRATIRILSDDPDMPVLAAGIVGTGLADNGSSLRYGNDFVALISGNDAPLRQRSDDRGNWSFFVPSEERFETLIFDPDSGLISDTYNVSGASGSDSGVGSTFFRGSTAPDSDFDGLPDDIELAIGTNANKRDSDGDGIDDFVAIRQGLDPNGGRAFPTGIIASLSLTGEAKDVVVAGNATDASKQLAYVATGSGGLAIVDASKFDKPVAVGQIDLAGDAVSVAVDARLNIAAVATGSAGLQLVNVADPARPVLLQTIDTNAKAVAVVDGIAYVGTSIGLESYDLLTGEQLQVLPLAGGVVSMAREASMLYTMDAGNHLRAIDISGTDMLTRGSLTTPEGGGRIFVGNGIAYVAASSKTNGGFDTVDVTNPDSLTLISGSDIAANIGVAGTAVAANGSGLTLTVGQLNFVFGGFTALDIFNSTDLTNTANFVTRVNLPAAPFALAIASGIAYVADGSAGLQVVNYLPFDNQGIAPTATLQSLTPDTQPGTAGLQVVEGTTVHLKATVTDDVQVRSVELLVNGQVIASDVSLPFDLSFNLPKISAGSSTINAQVRATDSGGNTTLSNVVTFNLIPDTIAPTIANIDPPNGSTRGPSSRGIRINFSEPMDAATLSSQNIRLLDAANHVINPINLQLRRDGQSVQLTYSTLDVGSYSIVIDGSALKDRAGNALGASNIVSSFTVTRGTISFINNAGGDWSDPANWDLGRVPNATDDVFIAIGNGATITHSSGTDTVRGLRTESPFTLSGGSLTITNQGVFNDTLVLSGGTLDGAGSITASKTVTWSGTSITGTGSLTFGVLSTVNVPAGFFPSLSTRNLNTNGTFNLATTLNLSGTAIINNGGTINITTDGGIGNFGGTPAINNSGTIIKTGGAATSSIGAPLINGGTISASTGTLSIQGGGSSSGRISAANGAVVQLSSGTFALNAGAILSGAGVIKASAGTISLNAAASAQNLTLEGGSITAPTGAALTVAGTFTWTGGTVGSGLTLNIALGGTLNISGNAGKGMTAATINNAGTATWTGNGGVFPAVGSVFNNSGTFSVQNDAGWNNNGGAASSFNNSGTLTKSAGTQASSFGLAFNNTGTATVTSGTLALAGGGTSSGIFNAAGGTIALTGNHAINNGASFIGPTFTRVSSGTTTISGNVSAVNFAIDSGTLDGTGTLTLTNTFSWTGGTMAGSGGLTRIVSGATLSITGNASKTISARTVTNEGTATWNGNGSVLVTNNSLFNNAGTFTIQNDVSWSNNGGVNSTFNNTGTLSKSAGTGTSNFSVALNNTGAINVATGTLQLSSGGVSSGTFNITSALANLTFSGASTLNAGASFTGPGMTHLISSNLTIAGDVVATNFSLEGGTVDGNANLTITDTLNWSGGTFAGAGATTAAASSSFNISGNAGKSINARTVNNAGSAFWTGGGGVFLTNNSVFNNSGTLTVQIDGTWTNNGGLPSTFNNSGTLNKTVGTGIATFTVAINNSGTISATTGTLALANGGTSSGIFSPGATGTISFSGGTHTLTPESSMSGAGTISFAGGVTDVNGGYSFGGTISATGGTVNLNTAGTFANLNVGGGTYGGSGLAHVSTSMNWSRGTLDGTGSTTIDAGGTLIISGTLSKTINRYTLINAGVGAWTGSGSVLATNASLFSNTGSMTIQTDATWNNNGGLTSIVSNSGSITKTQGNGTAAFGVTLNNTGSLISNSGTLSLTSGGTSSGTFSAGIGATLNFGGGAHTISSASSLAGGGTISFTNGTVNIDAGGFSFPGTILVSGGTANFNNNSLTVFNLTLSGGTLGGSSQMDVFNSMLWTAGTLSGSGRLSTSAASTTMMISGGSNKFISNGYTLQNNGVATWMDAGAFFMTTASTFDNHGTLNIQTDSSFNNNGGAASTFLNVGTLTKSAGNGTLTLGVIFTNHGAVNVQSGSITLSGGGSSNGNMSLSAGTTVNFTSGTFTLSTPGSISGAGALRVAGATVAVSFISASNFKLESGTVNGSGALTVTGTLDWTGGTFAGTGNTNINQGGTLNISGGGSKFLDVRTIWNMGTAIWSGSGGVFATNASLFDNRDTGTMSVQNDQSWNNNGGAASSFLNHGTLTKTVATGITTFGLNFTNFGTLSTNTGSFAFANFIQSSSGILNVQIGGTTAGTFDKFVVTGTATLAGTLNISLKNGFTPASGNTFQILTFGSRTGTFETIGGPDFALFGVQYNSNNVTLTT